MSKLTPKSRRALSCGVILLASMLLLSWRLWSPTYRAYESFWGNDVLLITVYLELAFVAVFLIAILLKLPILDYAKTLLEKIHLFSPAATVLVSVGVILAGAGIHALTAYGKSYIYQTSQQFVTDLILAISRGGVSPLLQKSCDVYILDDCFSLFPETLKILDQMHKASPCTSMFLLFDACIPLEKYVLPRLHVDNVFDIPAPCEAARRSFIKDYLDSEAGCGMNISMDRALAIASEYGHIAALRSAIQRESIERRYRHGTD